MNLYHVSWEDFKARNHVLELKRLRSKTQPWGKNYDFSWNPTYGFIYTKMPTFNYLNKKKRKKKAYEIVYRTEFFPEIATMMVPDHHFFSMKQSRFSKAKLFSCRWEIIPLLAESEKKENLFTCLTLPDVQVIFSSLPQHGVWMEDFALNFYSRAVSHMHLFQKQKGSMSVPISYGWFISKQIITRIEKNKNN